MRSFSGTALCVAASLFAASGAAALPQQSGTAPSFQAVSVAVLLPFLAAGAVLASGSRLGNRSGLLGAAVSAVCFSLVVTQRTASGAVGISWMPSLGVELSFFVDGLSSMLGILVSGIGSMVFLYAYRYMEHESGHTRFYSSLLMFLGSMLGLVYAGDLILLFVFWELTSVASFLLIGHSWSHRSSGKAARKSFVVTVGGGLFLLIGFLMLFSATGTFSIKELVSDPGATAAQLRSAGLFVPVLASLVVGAGAKSAQVPLHFWLPDAMEAPTPVSAFLHSATMVNAGVLLFGRFRPVMSGELWTAALVTIGLTTMTVAGLLGVASSDIKELLAYSTASHLGLIAAAFGFSGAAGAEAGSFHVFNHALFKASLFMVAGVVAHEAGTRRLSELSGLRRSMPVVSALAVVGGLSMAGVPPLAGFQSKELLFKASLGAAQSAGGVAWFLPVLAVAGSVLTFVYSMRFISVFFGEPVECHQPSKSFVLPASVLVVAIAASSLAPQAAVDLVVGPAAAAAGLAHKFHVHLIPSLSAPLAMSAVTILTGTLVFLRGSAVRRGRRLVDLTSFVSPNLGYRRFVENSEELSRRFDSVVQPGNAAFYFGTVVGVTAVAGLGGFLLGGSPLGIGVDVGAASAIVLGAGLVGAYKLTRVSGQAAGVLALSVVGGMIAVFYVLADAPDLALTQLSVETLSMVIFMLVLDRLPEASSQLSKSKKAVDAAVSSVVGVAASAAVLVASGVSPRDISGFFVENAVPEGGGGNIVNVILVDFRAFDTLGEITVIGMAAASVLVLLSQRRPDR